MVATSTNEARSAFLAAAPFETGRVPHPRKPEGRRKQETRRRRRAQSVDTMLSILGDAPAPDGTKTASSNCASDFASDPLPSPLPSASSSLAPSPRTGGEG